MNKEALREILGTQHVQCVPDRLLRHFLTDTAGSQYFRPDEKDKLTCIVGGVLDNNQTSLPHFEAEADPVYRQIILCVIIEDVTTGNLLITREKNKRTGLYEPFSLGLYEHVPAGEDIEDTKQHILQNLAQIVCDDVFQDDFCGFFYSNESAYDKAHIGLIFHIGVLGASEVKLQSSHIGDWFPLDKVARLYKTEALEPWSQVLFEKEVLTYLADSRDDSLRHQAIENLAAIAELEKNGYLSVH